ncbi:MAG: TMEM175 family protein [Actinomycetota bacterium]|nr:TMEM175 family protein [Actinomycetota bacterium]
MNKGRMEAVSNGVIAVVITVMALDLKIPHGADFTALRPLSPVFFVCLLSF